MIVPVTMPRVGGSMKTGVLLSWLVEEDDDVTAGQDIAEIETSKVTHTLASPAEGIVARLVAEPDAEVPVGALLALLIDDDHSDEELDRFIEGFEGDEGGEIFE